MIMETVKGTNLFHVFGGVPSRVLIREGEPRAQGPFRHPILAGTVGATCMPLFLALWKRDRLASMVGVASGWAMVWASASSGPIMSALAGGFAIVMWRFRQFTGLARAAAGIAYLLLPLAINEPAYYILKRINISGGSTGYHRARLIESGIEHLDEWWLFGTDYTSHWMVTGVSFSPNHTDITNYYLAIGVFAGLPALLLLVGMLLIAFRLTGRACRFLSRTCADRSFFAWCLGAGLFAHAATSISVAYFDQSLVFFWMNVALIGSLYSREVVGRMHPRAGVSDSRGATYEMCDRLTPEGVVARVSLVGGRYRKGMTGIRVGLVGGA
jgi:hypothetical protein